MLLALAWLALAACGGPPPPPAVTLRIGVFATQDFLPYYVMQEQGFDRQNGLTFKETVVAGGAAAIDAMASGTLDLCPGVGTMPLLAAAERGQIPEKAVAVAANNFADREHPGTGVIVARNVQGWNDLGGKQIGVNAAVSISAVGIGARLRQEGVRDYSFVFIPFSNMGLAVAGGNVAAAAMNEPHLTQSLQRGDGRLLDWVVGGPPLERTEYTTIVFSAELRRSNPQAVKAYLRAHLAAVRWVHEHPGEARSVLARRLNINADVVKKIKLLHWPADARSDPALLERTHQVLAQAGLFKQPLDTRTLHDPTLLTEVLQEKR